MTLCSPTRASGFLALRSLCVQRSLHACLGDGYAFKIRGRCPGAISTMQWTLLESRGKLVQQGAFLRTHAFL
jgi:hypothetical protein